MAREITDTWDDMYDELAMDSSHHATKRRIPRSEMKNGNRFRFDDEVEFDKNDGPDKSGHKDLRTGYPTDDGFRLICKNEEQKEFARKVAQIYGQRYEENGNVITIHVDGLDELMNKRTKIHYTKLKEAYDMDLFEELANELDKFIAYTLSWGEDVNEDDVRDMLDRYLEHYKEFYTEELDSRSRDEIYDYLDEFFDNLDESVSHSDLKDMFSRYLNQLSILDIKQAIDFLWLGYDNLGDYRYDKEGNMIGESLREAKKDLSKVKGSITQVLENDDGWKNATTARDVYDYVKAVLEENGIDTPASRRLLLNINKNRYLSGALSCVYNSLMAGERRNTIK